MKNTFPVVCIAATLFALSSCQKLYDYINPGRGHEHNYDCRIKKAFSGEHTFVFHYNAKGDPDTITTLVPLQSPNSFTFAYDELGRLTAFNTYYRQVDPTNPRTRSTYTYTDTGTVYEYLKNFTSAYEETSHLYSFDHKGRIIHETKTVEFIGGGEPGEREEIDYIYNANGNRIAPEEYDVPPYNYDNKKNIYGTSWVWQFIGKNYSKNNPYPATTYNNKGLPLTFSQTFPFLYSVSTSRARIDIDSVEYDCGGKNK